MSWMGVLKGKTARRRSDKAIELVDGLMSDKKPRTEREILDDLWTEVERKREEAKETGVPYAIGSILIPTTRELRYYLSNDAKYESAVYDNITGKITGIKRGGGLPHYKRKYWMK